MGVIKRGRGRPKSEEKSTTVWVSISTSRKLKTYVSEQASRKRVEGRKADKDTAEQGIRELLELANVCQQAWGNASIQSVIEQLQKTIEKTREQKVREESLDKFMDV
jgi:hypothetical protein